MPARPVRAQLKYVEVSFYNVARSLTIVFNVVLTYAMLGESTSAPTIGCLAAVVAGFFIGAKGEVRFSLLGTCFGVVSSGFVALNGIYQKKLMDVVQKDVWRLAAYNNINACLLFPPLIVLSGELSIIAQHSAAFFSARFWFAMVLGGVFGFLIGIVTTMQIKVTSPLTHNISGTAKACVQTALAFWIWQNPTTVENLLGIALVLLGSMAYTYVRNREMAAAGAPAARAHDAPGAPGERAAVPRHHRRPAPGGRHVRLLLHSASHHITSQLYHITSHHITRRSTRGQQIALKLQARPREPRAD